MPARRPRQPPQGQGFLGPGGMADVLQQRASGLPEPGYMTSFLGSNPGAEDIEQAMGPVMGMLGPLAIKIPIKGIPAGNVAGGAVVPKPHLAGGEITALKNPTKTQAKMFLKKSLYGDIRGLKTPEGDFYIFDAGMATHDDVIEGLGRKLNEFDNSNRFEFMLGQAGDDAADLRFLDIDVNWPKGAPK